MWAIGRGEGGQGRPERMIPPALGPEPVDEPRGISLPCALSKHTRRPAGGEEPSGGPLNRSPTRTSIGPDAQRESRFGASPGDATRSSGPLRGASGQTPRQRRRLICPAHPPRSPSDLITSDSQWSMDSGLSSRLPTRRRQLVAGVGAGDCRQSVRLGVVAPARLLGGPGVRGVGHRLLRSAVRRPPARTALELCRGRHPLGKRVSAYFPLCKTSTRRSGWNERRVPAGADQPIKLSCASTDCRRRSRLLGCGRWRWRWLGRPSAWRSRRTS
jgi:hypothetical protein